MIDLSKITLEDLSKLADKALEQTKELKGNNEKEAKEIERAKSELNSAMSQLANIYNEFNGKV
jgi:hypothetical protein